MGKPEILCLGEALIDMVPPELGTSIIERGELRIAAGGAPANVAVGLARLGSPVGFIGKVGADFFGQHLKNLLAKNGVDVTFLLSEKRANTCLAFVTWNERNDAEYLFYRNPSADTLLEPSDIDSEYLTNAKVLQFGSLLLATEPSASATYHALELASKAGVLLSYDINLRLSVWADEATARKAVVQPLAYANIVKLNRAELTFITGETDLEAGCKKLWREQFKLVIVTLDKDGCYYQTKTAQGYVPAFVAEVVDTVGTGDGFLAGMLDQLWRGNFNFEDAKLIEKACRQAAAVGSIVVGRSGGIPAMPTRQEVDQYLESHPAK
ncbi:MAG: carbohydrate kinase [Chloroflexi bacterium]|uniref:Carbohydrate kinase n=1 Tax=Candidatus Chlorohelix allophototropha TaxID=3003348 RepID=A0A8T7MAB4_9CHLR|nr:carbohydrate kinase [Chloroflexota bacterium]NWJ49196.1 carbohydrate kinase [Chloroflexota bacterium]WJW68910.1 carbohydrate kinase [Chloroflexota bacterium L227-S17]